MEKLAKKFVTPQDYQRLISERLYSHRGWLLMVPCTSGLEMCRNIVAAYERNLRENGIDDKRVPVAYGEYKDGSPGRVFLDGEFQTRLPCHVAGSDAYVVQCLHNKQLSKSVNDNLMELKLTGRALKVHGANHITAVLPYLAYSRGDKPTYMQREPVTSKLVADELLNAGFDAVISYHPHTEAVRGFFEPGIRFIPINGLDLAVSIAWQYKNRKDAIVIAPDVGSGSTARHFADGLGLDFAISDKTRKANGDIDSLGILGHLEGKKIGIGTEDETVTCDTLHRSSQWYHQAGLEEIIWIVSHLKVDEQMVKENGKVLHVLKMMEDMHKKFNVTAIHTTDSIPQTEAFKKLDFLKIHSIAERLMIAINHLFYEVSISGPFWPNVEKPMFND